MHIRSFRLLLAVSMLFSILLLPAACGGPTPEGSASVDSASPSDAVDPHSYSRPDEVRVRHLALDLGVDFQTRQLSGIASVHLDNPTGASELHLDTRDLTIRGVTLDDSEAQATYTVGEAKEHFGSPLIIDIQPDTKVVHIDYFSSPDAAALQWLEPSQTGGDHPFLLSQSQAILARTWVPCQDTPEVRMTYEATIRVPAGLMAVMSAANPQEKSDDGVYSFQMQQPVPSYLLALGVGDLEFRAIGERTGVYALPSVVEAAAYEFADTEKMIEASEELYGPYRWERYDMLVLPPSFPFGGMENPRLTFLTPTILAGDRSLTALVAHELAHSWSGNLVTNATWNDFWLNEGFTVYFERRIMEALYGRDYSEMLAQLGWQDLQATVEELGAESPDTHLYLDLAGRNPDDGMTDIAYEKGYFLLRLLEESVGREAFDDFLRAYFETRAFESVTTAQFLDYLNQNLIAGNDELAAKLQLDAWIYGPGIPANVPAVQSEAFTKVEAQIATWQAGTPAADLETEGWSSHEWLHFLRQLPSELSEPQMADLDAANGFTQSGNSEILHAWLHHVIDNDYAPGYPALETFLTGMGRRKFLKPLYENLAESEESKLRARAIYEQARPLYHAVSRDTVDAILGWPWDGAGA